MAAGSCCKPLATAYTAHKCCKGMPVTAANALAMDFTISIPVCNHIQSVENQNEALCMPAGYSPAKGYIATLLLHVIFTTRNDMLYGRRAL